MNILLIGHGYIGSFLTAALSSAGYRVSVCEHNPQQMLGTPAAFPCRYQELSSAQLKEFNAIVWLAGHSSVGSAIRDPHGAVHNNCIDLFSLVEKLQTQRFIYASTASVYSEHREQSGVAPRWRSEDELTLNPANAYDSSKVAFDSLMLVSDKNVTGLRFGTVCGMSPNLRPELVFNSMNRSASSEGVVRVANRKAFRSILFLEDLAVFLKSLLQSTTPLPKILNVASLSISLGELAKRIAKCHGAQIEVLPDSVTYSFRMNCERITTLTGFHPPGDIESACVEFKNQYGHGAPSAITSRSRTWSSAEKNNTTV